MSSLPPLRVLVIQHPAMPTIGIYCRVQKRRELQFLREELSLCYEFQVLCHAEDIVPICVTEDEDGEYVDVPVFTKKVRTVSNETVLYISHFKLDEGE